MTRLSPRFPKQLVCAVALAAASTASHAQSQRAAQQTAEAQLAQRLDRLERIVDGQGLIDLLQQVEALKFQVQQLQGRIESQNFALEQLRKQQRDIYGQIDGRLRGIEGGAAAAGANGAATEPPLAALVPNDAPAAAGKPADGSFNVMMTSPSTPGSAADPFAVAPQRPAAPTVGGALAPITTGTAQPATTALVISQPQPQPSALGQTQATPPAMLPAPVRPQTSGLAPGAAGGTATVAPGLITIPTPRTTAQGGAPARLATVDSPESEKAYSDAFGLLKGGQYEQAIAALRTFLAQYPASQYIDNAQYWLGEAFYTLRKFDTAIAEYQKLLQLYPDSQKYSHALLKIGYSYDELGQRDQARAILQQLKDNYPSTTAAQLADERLARIRAATMR